MKEDKRCILKAKSRVLTGRIGWAGKKRDQLQGDGRDQKAVGYERVSETSREVSSASSASTLTEASSDISVVGHSEAVAMKESDP